MLKIWNHKIDRKLIPADGDYARIAKEATPSPDVPNVGMIFPASTTDEPAPYELPESDILKSKDPMQ